MCLLYEKLTLHQLHLFDLIRVSIIVDLLISQAFRVCARPEKLLNIAD